MRTAEALVALALVLAWASLLISTAFAAVAAGASWMNVMQTRKTLKESVLPELHVTAQRVEPSGPVYGTVRQRTTVQFSVIVSD